MPARAKKTNRSKRVDSVRASRDGHQFHEAWVARRALGLLLPRFDLCGIAVEGLSEEDEEGAPAASVEIADATFYYGNDTSFESCARIEVAQFKYSISKAGTPLRIADLRKTLVKFAATEKELLSKYGAEAVARKVTYSINTNRPCASEVLEAFRSASTGQPAVSADADGQLSQLRSAVKQSDDGLRRFADRVLLVGRMDSLEAVERGNARTVADWSASNDALARARIGDLRDMVRKKAGSHGQRDKVVTQVDVLSALGLGHESELLPAPQAFPEVGNVVRRAQLSEFIATVVNASRWIVQASRGLGKTVFVQSVAAELAQHNEVVLFDCFGDEVGDGVWTSAFQVDRAAETITAGLIWFCLGLPHARDRWRAAHAVRTLAGLGRWTVIDELFERLDASGAGPFQDQRLPFFRMHAQQWFLLAIARIAIDYPREIRRHRQRLEEIAFADRFPTFSSAESVHVLDLWIPLSNPRDAPAETPIHAPSGGEGSFQSYGAYLARHALALTAGRLLLTTPLRVDRYIFDRWDEWLARYSPTRNDGLWVSDGLGRVPDFALHDLMADESKGHPKPCDEQALLRSLAGVSEDGRIPQDLMVDGSWSSPDGVRVNVSSTLVPLHQAMLASRAVVTAPLMDMWLPSLEPGEDDNGDHVRFGRNVAPLEAWITDPHVELQIDGNDPSGVREALQRPRPATRIIRTFRLRAEKPWTDSWIAPGKRVAFRSRAWGRQTCRGDRDDSDSGAALFATRPFLADFLTTTDRDLLVLIKLEHYRESERDNPADDEPGDCFTHAYSLLLVDRHLRVRPVVLASDDVATVANLDEYSIHDFQKRFAALSKSRGA